MEVHQNKILYRVPNNLRQTLVFWKTISVAVFVHITVWLSYKNMVVMERGPKIRTTLYHPEQRMNA